MQLLRRGEVTPLFSIWLVVLKWKSYWTALLWPTHVMIIHWHWKLCWVSSDAIWLHFSLGYQTFRKREEGSGHIAIPTLYGCPECGHDQSDCSAVEHVRFSTCTQDYTVHFFAIMAGVQYKLSLLTLLGLLAMMPWTQKEIALLFFLGGRDMFVSLPTGYGKSLCYFALPGTIDLLPGRPSTSTVIALLLSKTVVCSRRRG